jgi:hypothetical protein
VNGLIRASVPSQEEPNTWVHAGYFMPGTLSSSVLIAADTKELSLIAGHYTEFPSDEPTVLVQAPFTDGKLPEHTVLHDGHCG